MSETLSVPPEPARAMALTIRKMRARGVEPTPAALRTFGDFSADDTRRWYPLAAELAGETAFAGVDATAGPAGPAPAGAATAADDAPVQDSARREAEAMVARLRHAARNYGVCPFAPGDLVTPRPDSRIVGAGRPMLVVEVGPPPEAQKAGDHADWFFGARLDMRIFRADRDGDTVPYWVESWEFEPWEFEPWPLAAGPAAEG